VVRDILQIPELEYEDYPFLQWVSTQVGYVADDSDEGNCANAFITSHLSFNYDIKYLIFTIYFLNSETVGAEEVATNVHHSYFTNSFNKQSSNSDGSETSQDEYVFDVDDDDDDDLETGDEHDEIEYDDGEEESEEDNEDEDEDEDEDGEDGEEDEEEDSDEDGEEDDDD